MKAASPSCWLSAVPRWPFQPLASSVRNVSTAAAIVSGRARHVEADFAVFGQTVALAAQFLQLLRAQRLAQQFVGVARRIEAGADMGLQHQRRDADAAAARR